MRQAVTIAARDLRATYVSAFGVGCTAGFAALAGVLLVFDLRGNGGGLLIHNDRDQVVHMRGTQIRAEVGET